MPEGLLTTREVANLLRRTPATIRRWRKRGLLSAAGKLPDGGFLFERAEAERLLGSAPRPRLARADKQAIRAQLDMTWNRVRQKGAS
jgi:predicted site-specific integrase-resolvase